MHQSEPLANKLAQYADDVSSRQSSPFVSQSLSLDTTQQNYFTNADRKMWRNDNVYTKRNGSARWAVEYKWLAPLIL